MPEDNLLNDYEFSQMHLEYFRRIQKRDEQMYKLHLFLSKYKNPIFVCLCLLTFCLGYILGSLAK